MNLLDFVVLIGTMLGIVAYGLWQTRGPKNLQTYLKGGDRIHWFTIGLSVMATQASAITFISTPGQGYESGLGFVQFYLGVPFALVLIAAVFLPIYRRLNVYTAYEFLGTRFDAKTRLLAAALFLLQRGLAAGITIYAPAIILSTMLGWRLDVTIVLTGLLVIIYTVLGGSEAVSLTQKYQMAVIFGGMAAAFLVLLGKLPADLSMNDAFTLAGWSHRMNAVDFSVNVKQRYTLWTGLIGGIFLQLSYFGTDQSQVQRYISGSSLRESRLGLMFNAVFKIPMQFSILLLGVMLFLFYQFDRAPLFFNQAAWTAAVKQDRGLTAFEDRFRAAEASREASLRAWLSARRAGDSAAEAKARSETQAAQAQSDAIRSEAKTAMQSAAPGAKGNDADYVFITFVLAQLPHGIIGLLIAVFFAAALSSKAAELNALGSTTTVDFYRHVIRRDATDAHYVAASKWFTFLWGLVALAFALFANLAENLIQAINIVGSIFYGVVLALFLAAFFLKRVRGTAIFWAALAAQGIVFVCYYCFRDGIAYLWYNFIGCAACLLLSLAFEAMGGQLKVKSRA